VFSTKIVNHGRRGGDVMRALTQWRHPVASIKARDVLQWAMCHESHRRIRMTIAIASI